MSLLLGLNVYNMNVPTGAVEDGVFIPFMIIVI
jgi:hypothetical protein